MGEHKGDGRTRVERGSDRELVVTRVFDAPRRLVWDAWTRAELFQLWWAPKSSPVPMIACEMDVRAGGGYRVAFGHDAENAMSFYGKYIDVVPGERMVWTNDEGGEQGQVTTVTFEDEDDGRTRLVMRELYPSREAFEASAVGMEDTYPEQFGQLDALLADLAKA